MQIRWSTDIKNPVKFFLCVIRLLLNRVAKFTLLK